MPPGTSFAPGRRRNTSSGRDPGRGNLPHTPRRSTPAVLATVLGLSVTPGGPVRELESGPVPRSHPGRAALTRKEWLGWAERFTGSLRTNGIAHPSPGANAAGSRPRHQPTGTAVALSEYCAVALHSSHCIRRTSPPDGEGRPWTATTEAQGTVFGGAVNSKTLGCPIQGDSLIASH